MKSAQAFVLSLVVALAALVLPAGAMAQSLVAGQQDYVVLGREGQVHEFLQHVRDNEGSGSFPLAMESVVTLTATLDGQVIRYDHWEDGYEADIQNPAQPTTETHLLDRGGVVSLRSDGSGGGVNDVVPLPRDSGDLRYDGGDRIVSLGGQVNVTHNMWPENATYIGGAWEVYSLQTLEDF